MSRLNAGIFGYGTIGEQYQKILESFDINIIFICTKSGKPQKNHDSIVSLNSLADDLIDACDFYVVAVPPSASCQVVSVLDKNKPVLFEKPLFTSLDNLNQADRVYGLLRKTNWFLAMNRRFYKSVNYLKDIYCDPRQPYCHLSSRYYEQYSNTAKRGLVLKELPFYSTIHWLDLALYIRNSEIRGYRVTSQSPLHVGLAWQSETRVFQMELIPDREFNHEIRCITYNGQSLISSPIERLDKVSLEISSLDGGLAPATRCYSRSTQEVVSETASNFKPGYESMVHEFLCVVKGGLPKSLPTIADMYQVYELCDLLSKLDICNK